jgi:hypothetical protein
MSGHFMPYIVLTWLVEVLKENEQLWQSALFFPNKYSKGKCKVIPVQALTGPEGSMRLN